MNITHIKCKNLSTSNSVVKRGDSISTFLKRDLGFGRTMTPHGLTWRLFIGFHKSKYKPLENARNAETFCVGIMGRSASLFSMVLWLWVCLQLRPTTSSISPPLHTNQVLLLPKPYFLLQPTLKFKASTEQCLLSSVN